MSKTVYVIKPDGMPFRHTIRRRIEDAGLSIVESKVLKFPRWAYEQVYPRDKYGHVPQEALERSLIFSIGGESEVGIVQGPQALKRLLRISGKRADPARCASGTIRRDFGISITTVIDGYALHHKVIHRPESWSELQVDFPVIYKLLGT